MNSTYTWLMMLLYALVEPELIKPCSGVALRGITLWFEHVGYSNSQL